MVIMTLVFQVHLPCLVMGMGATSPSYDHGCSDVDVELCNLAVASEHWAAAIRETEPSWSNLSAISIHTQQIRLQAR